MQNAKCKKALLVSLSPCLLVWRHRVTVSGMEGIMRRTRLWAWLWITLGVLYFLLPLIGTLNFSLRARRGVLSFAAYESVFGDPRFFATFLFSLEMAVLPIIVSLLL